MLVHLLEHFQRDLRLVGVDLVGRDTGVAVDDDLVGPSDPSQLLDAVVRRQVVLRHPRVGVVPDYEVVPLRLQRVPVDDARRVYEEVDLGDLTLEFALLRGAHLNPLVIEHLGELDVNLVGARFGRCGHTHVPTHFELPFDRPYQLDLVDVPHCALLLPPSDERLLLVLFPEHDVHQPLVEVRVEDDDLLRTGEHPVKQFYDELAPVVWSVDDFLKEPHELVQDDHLWRELQLVDALQLADQPLALVLPQLGGRQVLVELEVVLRRDLLPLDNPCADIQDPSRVMRLKVVEDALRFTDAHAPRDAHQLLPEVYLRSLQRLHQQVHLDEHVLLGLPRTEYFHGAVVKLGQVVLVVVGPLAYEAHVRLLRGKPQ